MATQTEIFNLALSQTFSELVDSVEEQSRNGRACRLYWPQALGVTLEMVDPRWARRQQALVQIDETVNGFDYVYEYPVNCVYAREIYNPAKVYEDDRIEFEIGVNDAGDKRTILTNEKSAELIYTRAISNPGVFDALFVDALVYRLASFLAAHLKEDKEGVKSFLQAFYASVGPARAASWNERFKVPKTTCDFLRERQ